MTEHRFERFCVTFGLSEQWRGVEVREHQAIVVHPAGEPYQAGADPDELSKALVVRLLPREPGTNLKAYAHRVMLRHVPQGRPTEFASIIDGRPAVGFEWTDGVSDVATWFVEGPNRVWYRIDCTEKPSLGEDGKYRYQSSGRVEGSQLLSQFRWDPS